VLAFRAPRFDPTLETVDERRAFIDAFWRRRLSDDEGSKT
jgi:hypothetical protein